MLMLLEMFRAQRRLAPYREEAKPALDALLGDAEPHVHAIVKEKCEERTHLAVSGIYLRYFLDAFGEGSAEGADHLVTAFNLGIGIFDDATEGIPAPERRMRFDAFERAIRDGTRLEAPDDDAGAVLVRKVAAAVPGKERFLAAVHDMKEATYADDVKGTPDLGPRLAIGQAFADVSFHILCARKPSVMRYEPQFSAIYRGGTLLDDMTDVFDDYGVKTTYMTAQFPKQPSLFGALRLVPYAWSLAEREFKRGEETCPAAVRDGYRGLCAMVKGAYTAKIFQRFARTDAPVLALRIA